MRSLISFEGLSFSVFYGNHYLSMIKTKHQGASNHIEVSREGERLMIRTHSQMTALFSKVTTKLLIFGNEHYLFFGIFLSLFFSRVYYKFSVIQFTRKSCFV